MVADTRPPFATYLLPSFTLPFRRRQSSSTSAHSYSSSSPGDTPPSLSYSPRSSVSTSPGTSPPANTNLASFNTYTISHPYPASQKGLLHEALQQQNSRADAAADKQERLYRAHPNTLKCSTCATDVAFAEQVVSKGFTGRHGRAYLVAPTPTSNPTSDSSSRRAKGKSKSKSKETKQSADLINTKVGRNVNRELLTGAHVVADVSCVICCTVLGWKYVDAKEVAQRYKIGKYILEMKRVVQGVGWEDGDAERHANGDLPLTGHGHGDEHEWEADDDDVDGDGDEDNVVLFDEDDEDECEDLFAGVWDPEVVAKRRARRVGGRR